MQLRSVATAAIGAASVSAALLAGVVAAPAALAGGAPLSAELVGANEVPGPGDPDGSGTAAITINPGLEEVCWTVTAENLAAITGAHIHRGTADVAGPIVVHLTVGEGCATASRDLLTEILRDPSAFYVNVHSVEFRPGAIRGQLHR
jgi:hypothetical protein